MLRLERGAEDAGEVADALGDQEVVLHEPLDAARAGVVGVAHARRELRLQVEGQPLLRPAGEVVEMAAHRPEEGLGLVEARGLGRGQHAALDQLRDVVAPGRDICAIQKSVWRSRRPPLPSLMLGSSA